MELPSLDILESATQTINGALDLLKIIRRGLGRKKEPQEVDSLELQLSQVIGKLVQVQKDQMALFEENAQLKQALEDKNKWDRQSKRYQLHKTAYGDVVYILKKTDAKGEPKHVICHHCYQNGVKSFLNHAADSLRCRRCGNHSVMSNLEKITLGLRSVSGIL